MTPNFMLDDIWEFVLHDGDCKIRCFRYAALNNSVSVSSRWMPSQISRKNMRGHTFGDFVALQFCWWSPFR
jgi:hypothetical protein